MHPLTVEVLLSRELKKRTNDVGPQLGGARLARYSESVSTAGDFDVQAAFDLSQVLVKLSAQVGQTVVVGGFQDYVPGYFYSVQWWVIRPLFRPDPGMGTGLATCKTTLMVCHME
jgi:hypothetical protein